MNITAEVREKWRKKVEDDPHSEVRASAVKLLLKDIEELRAALKPFADAAEQAEDDGADDYGLDCSSARHELTIGDLRQAKRVYG